ncbi:MAG: hypothetical protein HY682_10960, partial [Chloroflexi bacterium]|nr:hypothetical protein [Chloroflexota bacterium]
ARHLPPTMARAACPTTSLNFRDRQPIENRDHSQELYRAILRHLVPLQSNDRRPLEGKIVLDPFMGGGTTLVEAQALGAVTVGFDTEALACRITALELAEPPPVDVWDEIDAVLNKVESRLRRYYVRNGPWEVLHYFWVDVVDCRSCRRQFDAHPESLLARDEARRVHVAFCRYCSRIHRLRPSTTIIRCACGGTSATEDSNARGGKYRCPWCGEDELIRSYVSRHNGRPPERRLVAKEEVHRETRARRFRAATRTDQTMFAHAARHLARIEATLPIPQARVAVIPGDSRPRCYGYRRYRDMFNDRQLLHHGSVLKALTGLREPARSIAVLAFSESLQTNCMFCPYAADWRRLAAVLSIHGYMYVTRPVELNPWHAGIGRGTLRNCIARIRRALESKINKESTYGRASLHLGSLDRDGVGSRVHYIVTDPPYFDNLDYSYLARFHSAWLSMLPPGKGVRKTGGEAIQVVRAASPVPSWRYFEGRLKPIFVRARHRLRRNGLFVFTFAHRSPDAWKALRRAIKRAGFCVTAVYGVEAEGRNGFHNNPGNLRWNALFVCRRRSRRRPHLREGELRKAIKVDGMSSADRTNLRMALAVARACR